MLTLPNGHSYKLVYLDTNVINEISKNTNFTGRNFLMNYANGRYAFVTSAFNIYELSRAKGKSYDAIVRFFDTLPLLVSCTYPQLIEFERISSHFNHKMILFATGHKPLFNIQLSTLLVKINSEPTFQDALSKMHKNFTKELDLWEETRVSAPTNWMQNFDSYLLSSMNDSFKLSESYFPIDHLGQYKSLEIYSFIKNQFVCSTNKPVTMNSIIDAYNASFLPYADVYVTERTVGAWLETSAKKKFDYIKDIEIVKLSKLYE